jgi:tol-pal system protein YbgF
MIKTSPFRLAAIALAFAAWMPLHASAGLLDDDEARRAILDLRAKVDALSPRHQQRVSTPRRTRVATLDILNQHEQTMQEIARLRGQLEVLANQIALAQKGQKDLYADLDARIKKLEPRQETIDGQTAEVLPTEKKSYDTAMELFKSGDYKAAASALQDFVRRYPDSAYAANAQYWLGNAYYAQRDYKNAIAAQEACRGELRHQRQGAGRDAQHRQQLHRAEGQKNAKKVLQQLVSKFPDTSAAATAKDRLATLK